MKSYSHFTQIDICCLFYLLQLGVSRNQIALILNKHRSSVSRLIKRCPGGTFNPEISYEAYLEKRKKCIRKKRIKKDSELFEYIQSHLYQYWSPEIIALKWNEQHKDDKVSFNTIYSAIRAGYFNQISAQTHLRRHGKQKYGHRSQYCCIQPEKTIHDLPIEAKYRERFDDWEGDTIRTTPGKGCVVTLLDRKSRYLLAQKVDTIASEKVNEAVKKAFIKNGIQPKTIVFDNGPEFAKYKDLEKDLQTSIYFADPHSPWQRGSNENINDSLRFFLPRGMDFRKLDDDYLEAVVSLLNNRPRKCLGLKSPHEVYCCT